MDDDLTALANRGGDLLLVGGARAVEGMPRLPADASLRQALGGTASSVSLRMARRWLAKCSTTDLYCPHDAAKWNRWAQSVSHTEHFDRTPVSDAEVRRLIRAMKSRDPSLSATRALREVRDSGIACEQKRFGQLFRTTAAR
jgi:hypothetical protein